MNECIPLVLMAGKRESCLVLHPSYKSFAHPHPPEKGLRDSAMSAPHLPSGALFAMACFLVCSAAYQRPPPRETLSVPLADDADGLTPQQVLPPGLLPLLLSSIGCRPASSPSSLAAALASHGEVPVVQRLLIAVSVSSSLYACGRRSQGGDTSALSPIPTCPVLEQPTDS